MNFLNLQLFEYLDKLQAFSFEFLKFNVFELYFFHFPNILLSTVYVILRLQTAQTLVKCRTLWLLISAPTATNGRQRVYSDLPWLISR